MSYYPKQQNKHQSAIEIPEIWLEPIIYHSVQEKLVNDIIRFKLIRAGRRSGKTWNAKRELAKTAMNIKGLYFMAAPTFGQAKRLFWNDMKKYIPEWFMSKPPMESNLILYLLNGSEIHIIGLDKPARIEGTPWTGGVIDEIDDCKPETWNEHIRPAFSTKGLNTWAWLLGVPNGFGLMFDLTESIKNRKPGTWAEYYWKASDILDDDEIQAARDDLSERQFKQEYEAEFVGAEGRVYPDFTEENITDCKLNTSLPIIWSHDFNFSPLSSCIMQYSAYFDIVYCIDEIILGSAVASQAAEEFCERYKKYKSIPILIYGDASGWIGDKHGKISDYIIIRNTLAENGFNVNLLVPRSNPAIRDGQNAVRAYIKNAKGKIRFYVDRGCQTILRGFSNLIFKSGSLYQEDDTNPSQHVLTAIRYYFAQEHMVRIKEAKTENTHNEIRMVR